MITIQRLNKFICGPSHTTSSPSTSSSTSNSATANDSGGCIQTSVHRTAAHSSPSASPSKYRQHYRGWGRHCGCKTTLTNNHIAARRSCRKLRVCVCFYVGVRCESWPMEWNGEGERKEGMREQAIGVSQWSEAVVASMSWVTLKRVQFVPG
jgi:hypothetical protein